MDAAVVLLSGGLDSSTTLAIAKDQGFAGHALTFAYGQRHAREVEAARAIATHLGAREHKIVKIDLRTFGGSALTDPDVEVPLARAPDQMSAGIPPTYVPARNTILLSYALAWSEVLGARAIFIGAHVYDASGYPDCRPEYYQAFEQVARLGTKRGVEGDPVAIQHPLIELTKAEGILGPDGGLVEVIRDEVPKLAWKEPAADVTGGMRAKVQCMLDIARDGSRCLLVSGLIPGRVQAVLGGQKVPSTEVR